MSEQKKKGCSPFFRQCLVTISICLNTAGHGSVIGFAAVLLPHLQRADSEIRLTAQTASWIASVTGPALLVGNFLITPVMSRLGRKAALYFLTLFVILGLFIMLLAGSFEVLLLGRILQGMSFGMFLPLRSVMLGEYTSPKNRGAFLSTISLSQAFGIFFIHLVGSLLSWQTSALILTFFFFTSAVIVAYCPESPSFLASRGRYADCREAFRWLREEDEEQELEDLIENCTLIERHKIEDYGHKRSFRDVLVTIKKKEFFKPIIVMAHAYVCGQFSGGSTMANYPIVIIGTVMGPEVNANLWMVALDTQRLFFNAVAIFVINKVRRRTMLFTFGTLSVSSHVSIAAYVYCKAHDILPYDAAWIPILLINLQVLAVAMAMVPIPSVIAGEVFPLEYRSIGGSVSVVVISFTSFLQLQSFPRLIESVGLQGTYIIYASILFYTLTVLWFLLPETKGKTLQEIEDEFRGRPLPEEEVKAKLSLTSDPRVRRASERKASIATLMHSTLTLS